MLAGTLASHYRVESQLGAGGMGVVYEAIDTRLGRRVALKVLHDESLSDAGMLARLEREARVLGALNHSNIAAIHGLEHHDKLTFLVLEYVAGETLADRLGRGALNVKEALGIARQIADALEAAHARGVIHRDLKPANIKLTPDGVVKVLDFGLAKALDPSPIDPDGATTVQRPADLTHAGVVLGTVAYMSPEQASGHAVDQRTDIWALGCVLFEMLSGKRAFTGAGTTELLVSVLDREPDWSLLRRDTPENVRRLLRRCLTKEPRSRLHHVADVRLELEETLAGPMSAAAPIAPRRGVGMLVAASLAAAMLIGAAAVAILGWSKTSASSERRVVRFDVDLPPGKRMVPAWTVTNLAFSQDGATLAYSTNGPPAVVVYSRRLSDADAQPLAIAKGLTNPLFSPDDRWLAMTDYSKESLVKLPLTGGAPVPLGPVEMAFHGEWGRDGYIYWTNALTSGIVRTPGDGGDAEAVTTINVDAHERNHRFARLLPGGTAVMFTVASGDMETYDDARIDVVELATKKRKPLIKGGTHARYSPSGHIVYARGGSLYAVPLDARALEVRGTPVKVLDGVLMSTNIGTALFDISPKGDLAYAVGPAEDGHRTMHWVDRNGNESAALPLPPRSYLNPRISPDGKYLAVEIEGPNHDLYTYDFQREVLSRISTDGISHGPIWSPDGRRIAFRTWKAGSMTLAWMPADRSGPAERLVNYIAWQNADSFSIDGQHLVFDQADRRTGIKGVWAMPISGDRKPRQFAASGGSAKFSPDGKWVAYCSDESGRPEVYVQSWPGPGQKIQISADGGTDPVWNPNGKELFYRNGTKMMSVAVTTTAPEFGAGKPQLLWTGDYTFGLSSSCGIKGVTTTSYDVSRDGQRFLMIKDRDSRLYATKVRVVLNWAEEFTKIVANANASP
jgi:serine/threonine-protein kinase